mmetsp:Transcript_14670/g.31984  ORF Transcript_14670/g.31984 Transcript_14670/m.31984 type:complete len:353 (-) Transcript_14670:2-1060(-)
MLELGRLGAPDDLGVLPPQQHRVDEAHAEGICRRGAVGRVALQYPGNEVLTFHLGSFTRPSVRRGRFPCGDRILHLVRALRVLPVRERAVQDHVRSGAKSPEVDLGAIPLSPEHLRGHVRRSPGDASELRVRAACDRKAEVRDLHDPVVADEEVVQLHVTVSDIAAVEVLDALEHLSEDADDVGVGHLQHLLEIVEEGAATLLHHHVEHPLVLKCLEELHHTGICVAELPPQLALIPHLTNLPRVDGSVVVVRRKPDVNDLGNIDLVRGPFRGLSDLAEAALAKLLPQGVDDKELAVFGVLSGAPASHSCRRRACAAPAAALGPLHLREGWRATMHLSRQGEGWTGTRTPTP